MSNRFAEMWNRLAMTVWRQSSKGSLHGRLEDKAVRFLEPLQCLRSSSLCLHESDKHAKSSENFTESALRPAGTASRCEYFNNHVTLSIASALIVRPSLGKLALPRLRKSYYSQHSFRGTCYQLPAIFVLLIRKIASSMIPMSFIFRKKTRYIIF